MIAHLLLALTLQVPADSLSLQAALARARQSRPLAVAAGAGVAEARGGLRAASALPNPAFSYSHSESYPQNHLLVEQPLDWLLSRGASRAAGQAGVLRAGADSAQVMAELAREVRVAYWTARAARETEQLARLEASAADSLAAIAASRYRAGEISLLEQEQAAQEGARARQAQSRAREDARSTTLALARAVGVNTMELIPTDSLDLGLDQLPAESVSVNANPAVRSAVADSVAAAAEFRATSLGRVPMPSLQAGAEWGDPSQPGTLSTLGFAIPLPLWNQGGGAVMSARARATRAAAFAGEARMEAVRLIWDARNHLDETALRAKTARDSLVPAAGRIRRRALEAYAAGETGILPALDALRNERQVLLDAIQDQLAFQQALADWHALSGTDE